MGLSRTTTSVLAAAALALTLVTPAAALATTLPGYPSSGHPTPLGVFERFGPPLVAPPRVSAQALEPVQLQVLNVKPEFDFNGQHFYCGTVENTSTTPIEQIHVSVQFYQLPDIYDYTVPIGMPCNDFPFVYVLEPGATAEYWICPDPSDIPKATHYTVAAYGTRTTTKHALPFEATPIPDGSYETTEAQHFTFVLRNTTGLGLYYPLVSGREGRGVDASSTQLVATFPGLGTYAPIASGDATSFDVAAPRYVRSQLNTNPQEEFYWSVTAQGRSEPPSIARQAGPGRYDTAVQIARSNFETASTVVLATGEKFPDALSAAGLAGCYNAPLLLTQQYSVPDTVTALIRDLGAKTVVIVGGETAVGPAVVQRLHEVLPSVTVTRVADLTGAGRFGTAAEVAKRMRTLVGKPLGKAIVARGDSFADALSAAPYAYSQHMPILLVKPAYLPQATRDVTRTLGLNEIVVVGGVQAVPDSIAAAFGIPGERVAGAGRYATSLELANFAVIRNWANHGFVGIASGANYPDALGGGVACGNHNGVMLLTPPQDYNVDLWKYLYVRTRLINRAQFFGGTPAISDYVYGYLNDSIMNIGDEYGQPTP